MIQTLLFCIFALLVIAGLAGIFGSGPLATREMVMPAAVVEFPHFARARSPESVIIRPRGADEGHINIHIDRTLVDALRIETIAPQPASATVDETGILYTFGSAASAQGPISFKAQPQSPGLIRGRISIDGHDQSCSQIIWP